MNEGGQDSNLDRLRKLSRPVRFLRVRVRLLASVAVGLVTLLALMVNIAAALFRRRHVPRNAAA